VQKGGRTGRRRRAAGKGGRRGARCGGPPWWGCPPAVVPPPPPPARPCRRSWPTASKPSSRGWVKWRPDSNSNPQSPAGTVPGGGFMKRGKRPTTRRETDRNCRANGTPMGIAGISGLFPPPTRAAGSLGALLQEALGPAPPVAKLLLNQRLGDGHPAAHPAPRRLPPQGRTPRAGHAAGFPDRRWCHLRGDAAV